MSWPDRPAGPLHWPCAVLLASAAVVSGAASARCEVSVEGTAAAVRVEAQQASVADVLTALEARLGVRHRSLVALDEVTIGGTYSGTLEDVLRRVLAGLNYVISIREGTIEVTIVGRSGNPPPPYADKPPASPANANPAAHWRAPKRQP